MAQPTSLNSVTQASSIGNNLHANIQDILIRGMTVARLASKISGSLIGAVLYPLKALILAFLVYGLMLGAALVGLLLECFYFNYLLQRNPHPLRVLGLILLFVVVMTVVNPLLFVFCTSYMAGALVLDLGGSLILGLVEGYTKGLSHVLQRSLSLTHIPMFNRPLRLGRFLFEQIRGNNSPNTTPLIKKDANGKVSQNPLVETEPLASFGLLSKEEIEANPTNSRIQQYQGLYQALEELEIWEEPDLSFAEFNFDGKSQEELSPEEQEELNAKTRKTVDQVFISMPIKQPVLLIKQYQDEDGIWRAIPTKSRITDQTRLEKWLMTSSIHPIFKDNFNSPDLEKTGPEANRPTRYRIHPYNNSKDLNKVQELGEIARRIRNPGILLTLAPIAEAPTRAWPAFPPFLSSILGSIGQTFHGRNPPPMVDVPGAFDQNFPEQQGP